MDPVSVTLAVLALATALKDIVEVSRAIQDSFSKLPANYENAQKLMKDVCETLEGMQATYSKEMESLDKDRSLKKSLDGLKNELNTVYKECAILIPPVNLKRRNRFKIAVYSFWNREKVEELILGLKSRVDKSLQLFSLLSSLRVEQTVNQINHTLHTALQKFPAALRTVRRQNLQISNMPTVSDARLFLFSQSSSTPMTWIPDTIPAQDLSKAYLRRELGALDKSLQALSVRWFENSPTDLDMPPFNGSLFLAWTPSSLTTTHRNAVQTIFHIQTLMEAPAPLQNLYGVNVYLSHLAEDLGTLQMHDEAVSVHNLTVDLWTALATVYPGSTASDHLVAALTSLSSQFLRGGDREKTQMVCEQALEKIQSSPGNLDPAMQALLADNLNLQARNCQDPKAALKLAEASVGILEGILGISERATTNSQIDEDEFAKIIGTDDDIMDDRLFMYSSMLSLLADLQAENDLLVEASRIGKRALTILHRLSNIYPGSSRILKLSSNILFRLSGNKLSHLNTQSENAEYTQEYVEKLTELAKVGPQRYLGCLVSALWIKRDYFLSAGKSREAQKIHQQMIDLGGMAELFCSGMKIPSETEGDFYFQLATYHFSSGRFQDAIYAAQNAASQFSALDVMSPGWDPVKRFSTMTFLCTCLAIKHQYGASLAEGFRALQVLDKSSIRGNDPAIVDSHMELLDKMMDVLDESSDSRTLEWARHINSRVQKLFRSSGHKIRLKTAQAPIKYVSILQKHDLIEEAALYLQDTVARWKDTYGDLDHNLIGISYLRCLMALPRAFKASGEIDKALQYSQQAMDVAEGYFKDGFDMLKPMIYITMCLTHVHLLCDAGRYADGMALSELEVAYARETASHSNGRHGLVQALGSRTLCQLYTLQPEAAIASATEALSLCRKELATGIEQDVTSASIMLTLLYVTLLNLTAGLSDIGDTDQALIHLKEAEETLVKEEIIKSEEPGSAIYDHQVVSARISRILFAKGNHAEAASLIEEVIVQERELVKSDRSVIGALLNALQYAGILYCTVGRHADGISSANEAVEIKKRLENSPGFAHLVEVAENINAKRGSWKSVLDAKNKLRCGHQDLG